MSRTIPRAYVTAAWNPNPVIAREEARKYCRELVKEGYLPLCPVLAFDGIFSTEDTESHIGISRPTEEVTRQAQTTETLQTSGAGLQKKSWRK